MDSVGFTSRLTAAARARESERPNRLFDDPLAARLAGPEGFEFLDRHWAAMGATLPNFEARTRFFDDFLIEAAASRGIRQIVLAAAGLDTRAFRIDWPSGTRIFELDQAPVLAHKLSILESASAEPRCSRVTVASDLREDWQRRLVDAGYDAQAPSAWLVEGLLMYLPEAANEALLTKCAALCCAGSRIGMDILPNRLMNNKNFVELYAERGHPLRYTSDDPMPMLARCGWRGTSHSSPEVAAKLGRSWPVPANAPTTLAGFILADRIN